MPEPGLPMVFYGTLTISGISSFGTACWTTYRGTPNSGAIVAAAAANSAITGATFFGIREYAVSPLLTSLVPWTEYAERRRKLGLDTPSGDTLTEEPLPPSNPRTKNLLDSGISGAITGGIHRGMRSGGGAVASGSIFGAAVCLFGQYTFNELNFARLRYIAGRNERNATDTTPHQPTYNPRTGKEEAKELPRSWTEMFLVMFGLVPMSDEEYIARLKRTREAYLKKIAQLEVTVAMEQEEKRQKELSQS